MKIRKRRYTDEVDKSCQRIARNFVSGQQKLELASMGLSIRKASRWSIDDIHNLWNIDLMSTDFSSMWLPHDSMVIEYDFPADMFKPQGERPGRWRIEVGSARVAFVVSDPEQQWFTLVSWWRSELYGDQPTWVFAPNLVTVHKHHLLNPEPWLKDKHITICTEMDPKPEVPMITGLLYPVRQQVEEMNYTTTQMASDLVDDLKLVLSIMAMLSCTNIEVVSEDPSPWLNKKRKKKGKPPLPRYHAITLHNTKASVKAHREAAEEERTHASPRPHWRRGHPRTYASGKRVWVRPCRIRGGGGHLPEYEMI